MSALSVQDEAFMADAARWQGIASAPHESDPLEVAREVRRRMLLMRDIGGREVQPWLRRLEFKIAALERTNEGAEDE